MTQIEEPAFFKSFYKIFSENVDFGTNSNPLGLSTFPKQFSNKRKVSFCARFDNVDYSDFSNSEKVRKRITIN
jgi:hypothetical protein